MSTPVIKSEATWKKARIAKPSAMNPKAGYCTRFDLYILVLLSHLKL